MRKVMGTRSSLNTTIMGTSTIMCNPLPEGVTHNCASTSLIVILFVYVWQRVCAMQHKVLRKRNTILSLEIYCIYN